MGVHSAHTVSLLCREEMQITLPEGEAKANGWSPHELLA